MITSSESLLDQQWATLREKRRTGLVPYLTAGYPSLSESHDALQMADRHSDVIEVGVPFSDPLADGPVIQAASFRALENGMTLARTLALVADASVRAPVVLFSYLNPVLQYGVERLVRDAAEIGIAGLLLTDLPAGADPSIEAPIMESSIDLIRLVAPTTRGPRLARVVDGAQGFLYVVARLGVTGISQRVASGLAESVATVRAASSLPIAVGFGISTPAQAREVAQLADGVVVGSALVDILGREGVAGGDRFLGGLRAALDGE